MNQKTRVHIFVSGRVQGVFFRQGLQKKAQSLGVNGWVKNLTDGRVEAIVEGEKEKIKELIEWVKRGPILAKIEEVKIDWQEYQEEFDDFEIKRD